MGRFLRAYVDAHLSSRRRGILVSFYLFAVIAAFIYFNISLTVEWVVLFLIVAAVLSGRGFGFLRDWGAFILVLLAWQITSPVATQLPFPWHVTEMIAADRVMFFGQVPAQWLQQHLYHPGRLEPWDYAAAVIYMLHFVTPLVAGFLLWLTNRGLFHRYMLAFTIVAIAGYITWIVYPAVPPWMAADHLRHIGHVYQRGAGGRVYLHGVRDLFHIFVWHWYNGYNGNITLGFLHGHVDQVGAVPSEHAAFPLLMVLFFRRQFGRWGYLTVLYLIGLVFAVMYLGQHYFFDVLVGFAYAGFGYAAVMYGLPLLARRLAAHPRARILPGTLRRWSREEA